MQAGRPVGADSMEEKATEAARHTSNESAVTTCFLWHTCYKFISTKDCQITVKTNSEFLITL